MLLKDHFRTDCVQNREQETGDSNLSNSDGREVRGKWTNFRDKKKTKIKGLDGWMGIVERGKEMKLTKMTLKLTAFKIEWQINKIGW